MFEIKKEDLVNISNLYDPRMEADNHFLVIKKVFTDISVNHVKNQDLTAIAKCKFIWRSFCKWIEMYTLFRAIWQKYKTVYKCNSNLSSTKGLILTYLMVEYYFDYTPTENLKWWFTINSITVLWEPVSNLVYIKLSDKFIFKSKNIADIKDKLDVLLAKSF